MTALLTVGAIIVGSWIVGVVLDAVLPSPLPDVDTDH